MLKTMVRSALVVAGMCFVAGSANAGLIEASTGESSIFDPLKLQTELDDATITPSPNPGKSSVDASADYLQDSIDSYWSIVGYGGGATTSTMVFEFAGGTLSNYTFGIFDFATGKEVTLFDQSITTGQNVNLTIYNDFTVVVDGLEKAQFGGAYFGYFLSTGSDATVYSDSYKNKDQYDHMLAYQGQGDTLDLIKTTPIWDAKSYVLAFEQYGSDPLFSWDYADLAVLVNNVSPAPEPATLVLLGTGVAGLTGMVRRRKAKSKYNFTK